MGAQVESSTEVAANKHTDVCFFLYMLQGVFGTHVRGLRQRQRRMCLPWGGHSVEQRLELWSSHQETCAFRHATSLRFRCACSRL